MHFKTKLDTAFSFLVDKTVQKPFLHASCSSQISLDTSVVDKIRVLEKKNVSPTIEKSGMSKEKGNNIIYVG